MLALLTAFAPGDRVAMARPGYVAYRNCVRTPHMTPIELACGPAEVCRTRGVRVVSDEIYHGLSFGPPAQTMLAYEPEAFMINSFSKYFSMAGWRLGWLVVPAEKVQAARNRIGNLFLTPPSLSQHAALAAFDCMPELDGNVEVYRHNRDLLLAALPALGLREIAPPDGAFYIYASIAHLTDDSLAFCTRMPQEIGVATAPGIDFDPVDGHYFMRFGFAVSTALVREAITRLTAWLPYQPLRS